MLRSEGHISRDKIGRSQQHFITGVRGADIVMGLWYDFDEVHTEQLINRSEIMIKNTFYVQNPLVIA
mgnify:CR=1 FL=1